MWSENIATWASVHPYLSVALTIFLVVLQAIQITYLVLEYRIARESTLLPGVFYILISSIGLVLLPLSSALIANTFFILALSNLFFIYKKISAADKIFNVGFWLALASFFYPIFSILLFLAFTGVTILRSFNLKEILMVVCGFIVPYIILGTYYFWIDSFPFFIQKIIDGITFLNVSTLILNWEDYVLLGIFASLIIFVIFNAGFYLAKKDIRNQKNINILYRSLIIIGITALFQSALNMDHLHLLAVPLSILFSFSFSDTRKIALANGFHILLFVGILVFHYYRLFSF